MPLLVLAMPMAGPAAPVEASIGEARLVVARHAQPVGDGIFRLRAAVAWTSLTDPSLSGAVLVTSRCREKIHRVPGTDEPVRAYACPERATREFRLASYELTIDPTLATASLTYPWRNKQRTITWTGTGDHQVTQYPDASPGQIEVFPETEVCARAGVSGYAYRAAEPAGRVFGQPLGSGRTLAYMLGLTHAGADIAFTGTTGRACCDPWFWCR